MLESLVARYSCINISAPGGASSEISFGLLSDSGNAVHGESNDTLCASHGSKLVEKYNLEESSFFTVFNSIVKKPALC